MRLSALNDREKKKKETSAQYFGKVDSPRGLKISAKREEKRESERKEGRGSSWRERWTKERRLVNSYVCSVRSDCEALTRRANTKKKKIRRRRWKRCRTRSEAEEGTREGEREGEREKARRGRRKGKEHGI